MKYVLLFVEDEEFAAKLAAMDDAERQDVYTRLEKWFVDHDGQLINHGHLQPAHTATTVRLTDGDMVVTDGPFVEGKEIVSGYAEIDVADLDEALSVVRDWPACPIVEIRPLD